MNKKRCVIAFALILIMLSSCKNKDNNSEIKAAESEQLDKQEINMEVTTETLPPAPGVEVYFPEDGDGVTIDEDNTAQNINNKKETESDEDTDDVQEQDTEENTEPVEENTQETDKEGHISAEMSEYERYINMSGEEQQAYIESFSSVASFFEWLNNAKAEYEANTSKTEIDGSVIDFSQIVGNQ